MKTSPKWIPGIQNNLKVRSKYNLPITFSLADDSKTSKVDLTETLEGKAVGLRIESKTGATDTQGVIHIKGVASSPMYIIDGKKQDKSNTSPLKDLDQNDIASIEVLKDATANDLYGDEGKNGVIIITTKNKKASSTEGKPLEKQNR